MEVNKEIYDGFVDAAWQMINRETMYTDLDRLERKDADSIAKALRDVAADVICDMIDHQTLAPIDSGEE